MTFKYCTKGVQAVNAPSHVTMRWVACGIYAVHQGHCLLIFVVFFAVSMSLALPPVFSLPARK